MFKISAKKFLAKYYNIQVSNYNNITHNQMFELFGIEACLGCDTAIDDIREGRIILVEDSEKYIMGYINPLYEKDILKCEELFEHPLIADFYKNLETETGLKKEDVHDLKMYQLEDLLRESKRHSDNLTKYMVIKELQKRKEMENNSKEEKLEKVRKREYREEMIK